MKKFILCLFILSSLTACGGGGGVDENPSSYLENAFVQARFSDGAGVARAIATDGFEMVVLGPDIVNGVAQLRSGNDTSSNIEVSDFAIADRVNGYNIRTGTLTSDGFTFNVVTAEEIGYDDVEIIYMYGSNSDLLAIKSQPWTEVPTGTFAYSGIYTAGARHSAFADIGTVTVSANFGDERYSINATGNNSSLSGSGFIDMQTGRLSGSTLLFNAPNGIQYSATAVGNFGGADVEKVAGIFYTNDPNPDYGGAFAGSK